MTRKEWENIVRWQISVNNKTPEEAARAADKIMRQRDRINELADERFNAYGRPKSGLFTKWEPGE